MWNLEEQDMHTSFVVGCTLDNEQFSSIACLRRVFPRKFVDKPMFVIDSAAPVTFPVAERLRSADACIPVALNVLDEQIDSL